MGVGQGIGQGLMFLAQQIAEKKRGERRQSQQEALFNLRRQANLEDMATRQQMQAEAEERRRTGRRQEKQQQFADIGNLLMQLDPGQAERFQGIAPEALGQAQSLGLLAGLQKRESEAQKQAELEQFLQDPNIPESTRQALQYQALTGRGGTAAFRLPGQMESDAALQQLRQAQQGLIPLRAEGLRARTAATRQRAAMADPTQFETVTEEVGGKKVRRKRRRGAQAGPSDEEIVRQLLAGTGGFNPGG